MDAGAAQRAIQTIIQFPLQIDKAGHVAANTPLGPWKLYVRCSYGSCNGTTRTFSWNADFSGSRTALQNVCQSAEQHGRTFLTTFKSVNDWLQTTLPNFSKQFAASSAKIMAILNQVQGNNPTAQQRADLAKEFDLLVAGLSQNENQLTSGLQDLVRFANQQSSWGTLINNAQSSLLADGRNVLTQMQSFTRKQPCGQGDANNQVARMQNQFNGAVSTFQATFGELSRQTQAANAALSELAGVVMNFAGQCQGAANDIKSAQGTEFGNIMKKVKVIVADNKWKALADYAAQQFRNPALAAVLAKAA